MKKLFKIIGIVIGGLLAIIIIAVTAFVLTFDANNYKKEITEQVEQHTGRKFEIAGNIEVSVFPWIGIKVDKVGLGNAPGFSKTAFATISQLDVKIKFLPLLEKKVEVDKIRIHGLSVSLETDANGKTNWDDLAGGSAGGTAAPSAQQPAAAGKDDSVPALAGLAVNGLELINANIVWADAKNNVNAKISSLDLETGEIQFGKPIPVKLSVKIENNAPEMQASIIFNTQLKINEDFSLIDAIGIQLGVDAAMPSALKERISFVLSTDTHVDMKQQTVKLSNTKFSVFDLVMSGDFDVNEFMATPKITGTLAIKEFDANELTKKLQVELPPMAGEQSLKNISVTMKIETDTKSLNLDDVLINLDASTIKGWLHVDDIASQKIQFSLAMDAINIEDYMAPKAEPTQTEVAQAAPAAAAKPVKSAKSAKEQDVEIALPMELLRSLNLKGEFVLGETSLQGIPIKKFRVNTQIEGGVVKINPIEMNVLNTDVKMAAQVDARKAKPAYSFVLDTKNLDSSAVIDPILESIMGDVGEVKMIGKVNLSANIKTRGNWLSALKKSAKGEVKFSMGELGFRGIDFDYFVRSATVKLMKEKKLPYSRNLAGEQNKSQKNLFYSLNATFKVAKGKASNKDFLMDSKLVKVTGSGDVDFINGRINYQPVIQKKIKKPVGIVETVLALPVIFHIHGPFGNPEYDLNYKLYARNAGRVVTQHAKAKAIKKLKQKGKSKWGNVKSDKQGQLKKQAKDVLEKNKDKLKGLFGR